MPKHEDTTRATHSLLDFHIRGADTAVPSNTVLPVYVSEEKNTVL